MRFEDLVDKPEQSLREITDWLGIPFEESLLQPSKLGREIESGSSFSPTSEIDARTKDRGQKYFVNLTTASERDVYNRCLANSAYAKFYSLMPPKHNRQSIATWFRPYKHERIRDYLWRLATGQGREGRASVPSSPMQHRLSQLYLSGRLC